MIKFFNIYKQDKNISEKIITDIKKIIKSNSFINGSAVIDFEKNFAKYCGSKYAIACANGTDAIFFALKALGLKNGSEVILPAMTYCSTIFSVINSGLKPILADINDDSPLINVDNIQKLISKKTKVIMPVHLYGNVVDIKKIKKIIKNKKIFIIDDCAQAHGAFDCSNCINYKKNNCCKLGKRVGALSDISCFSLYPGKNLGAYGDAGIITTNNKKIYNYLKKITNLGSIRKFHHELIGFNSRLDTIQASVLNNKLNHLDKNNRKRSLIAKIYNTEIKNSNVKKIEYTKGSVFHQYVIKVKEKYKIKLIKLFHNNNIEYGFHYPKSLNKLNALKNYFINKKYLNSETLANECISLPIDPNLSKANIKLIIKLINSI
jgi:dTDP-4-amino-4,6-dideoxygalactose transaminase